MKKAIILLFIFIMNLKVVSAEEIPTSSPSELSYISTTLMITEVYPSPDTSAGEKEWLEIYNYGDEPINLIDFYLREKGSINGYTNTKSVLPDMILEGKTYLVINDEDLNITLNNSGDTITLFSPLDEIIDVVSYSSISSGRSAIRKIEQGEYIPRYQGEGVNLEITEVITKGAENITHEELDPIELSTIAEVRKLERNTEVYVEGRVVVERDLLGYTIFYIQDDSAGIKIDLSEEMDVKPSPKDVIRVKGELSETYGELKINAKEIEFINQKKEIIIHSLSEDFENSEGQLVAIEGEIIKNYSTSFDLQSGNTQIRVSILSSSGIDIPSKSKGDRVKVVGILSQYNALYRILPRYNSDIQVFENTDPTTATSTKSTKKQSTSKSSSKKVLGAVKGNAIEINYQLPTTDIFYINNKTAIREVYLWPFFLLGLVIYLGVISYSQRALINRYFLKVKDYIREKKEVFDSNTQIDSRFKDLLEY